jgi:DNA-binding SARP family transcriptional activator
MSTLVVSLFGKLRLRVEGGTPVEIDSFKAQELFCYLLLFRDRPHTRERLADTLWADSSPSHSKQYLRQTLWQLRGVVDPVSQPDNPILLVESEWIQVNANAALSLDVAEFEKAYNLARGTRGYQLDARQAEALRRAIPLYKGDLMENWYQDWCIIEQERFQNMYLDMLHKLMALCERSQEYEEGLHYATLILRSDRAREKAHRRIMRLRYLIGDRTGALRQYERCVKILRDEFGVEPSQQTTDLYNTIQADAFVPLAPPATHGSALRQSPPQSPLSSRKRPKSLSSVLGHLDQLSAVLRDAQRQLDEDIEEVTHLLQHRDR